MSPSQPTVAVDMGGDDELALFQIAQEMQLLDGGGHEVSGLGEAGSFPSRHLRALQKKSATVSRA